jgi:TRAP-type mannitol/chloroaromatic compound transport system substrate-binding protein
MSDHYKRGSGDNLNNEYVIRTVEAASDGRLEIEWFAVDELMPGSELEDAVTKGVIDGMNSYGAFWDGIVGKIGTIEAACTTYMPPYKQRYLVDDTNYLDIVRAAWGEVGVYYLYPKTGHPVGDYVFSSVDLKGIEGLKGLPFRSAGASAEILTELGAATAYFPFAEIYTAMETGVVKACEFGDATTMYEMGLQNVAKHWYIPAFVQGGFNMWIINQESWDALPDDIKVIWEAVAKSEFETFGLDRFVNDQVHLYKAQDEGVTLHRWSPEEIDQFIKAWITVMDKLAAEDPQGAELWQLVKETRIFLDEWPE